ncbi:energy transducer TonB [Pontibacter oryzae]|uniref:Energy transducer TonB n=1 Tax=Pontibacter oryzae TaxID=2304593 RepID=A0A399S6U3_9BACT|nr:energy transducer TonB [Pontibacter oryzae]RIJ37295.1 energy transducer TonB [Pontibacter oryzae]
MEKSSYLSMTFNNIVFKGRNQAYGAYVLRKAYSKNMTRAYLIATAIFSGALVGPLVESMFFATPEKYVKPVFEVVEPIIITLPPPPESPKPEKALPPATAASEKVATERFVKPKVVSNDAIIKEEVLANQEDLSKVNIGTQTIEGDLPEIPTTVLTEAPPTGIEAGTAETPDKPDVYLHVEQMPEFEGGTKALMNYLSRKLRYPSMAQSNGIEGTVVVTFVVNSAGEISDVKVLKGLGFGTDEEAARVIQSMPNWQPGRQNGRAVPVRYTLPIKFSLK